MTDRFHARCARRHYVSNGGKTVRLWIPVRQGRRGRVLMNEVRPQLRGQGHQVLVSDICVSRAYASSTLPERATAPRKESCVRRS